MILVTGGTGLVGAHLLYELAKTGQRIRATRRAQSNLAQVRKVFGYYTPEPQTLFDTIEWVEAPLQDLPALDAALQGIDQVYHCAALISFDTKDRKPLLRTNVIGTANLVNLCIHHKVKKLCYVSSIAAIGSSLKGQPANEENEWNENDPNVYAVSKYLGEMEIWRASQEGVPVVLVNPGVIIGPGFWHSGSGEIIVRGSKKQQFYPLGATGFVGVYDVVKSMIQLMDSPIKNQRYILVAENLSFQEVLGQLAKNFGHTPPSKGIPKWLFQIIGFFEGLVSWVSGRTRQLNKHGIRSLSEKETYDNSKLIAAVDFTYQPMDQVFGQSCGYYRKEIEK
ncbi:NAD-dependent epimerase/dehydratase family protein [Sediminicola luteus]|uniref:NAD-dependent epimerase n=1 Tax=Sediminicola luteus TaxID=319238 RepID=A0A2A4G2S4_9FLAO|nr:NAD-dependent epimerase/dehydratase family protein [Sediminicola luteus]PCE62713.1 NAD-dependent epimerase [Sediminicola luteus]